jgi:hypothetical protein
MCDMDDCDVHNPCPHGAHTRSFCPECP